MVAPLPRRRRGAHRRKARPQETVYLLTVVAGLLLLALSTWAFYKKASERRNALPQLRAAKDGRGSAGVAALQGRRSGGQHIAVLKPRQLHEAAGQQGEQEAVHAAAGAHTAGSGGGDAGVEGTGQAPDLTSAANQPSELKQYCEQHFGLDWMQRWGATAQQVCFAARQLTRGGGATGGNGAGSGGGGDGAGGEGPAPSVVTCRSMNDTHMPAASAPHVLCDATNLRMDPSKMRRTPCPRYRPGYLCLSPTYHAYQSGAWGVDCSWPGFSLQAFSKDHQQDIFGSMLFQPDPGSQAGAGADVASGGTQEVPAVVEELPTLLVTRETKEHANVYHAITDLLNVYITLRMLGWEQRARQVVILDAHPAGPLDILWPVVAAGGGSAALAAARQAEAQGLHPWAVRVHADGGSGAGKSGEMGGTGRLLVRRVEDFKAPVLFRHAAFVPPGYTSLLFAHLYEDASCPLPTRLFAGFRRFFLAAFGLDSGGESESGTAALAAGSGSGISAGSTAGAAGAAGAAGRRGGTLEAAGDDRQDDSSNSGTAAAALSIRLISRRPGPGKRRMARQIGNEEELLSMLRSLDGSSGGGGSSGSSGSGTADVMHGVGPLTVTLVDFAGMTMEQQLAVVQSTDILIGMHGAALAHALLMPPHAALVELWPQADGIWRCYQNFAQWAGALYRRVANTDPRMHKETAHGDVTQVDAAAVRTLVEEVLPLVAARRRGRAAAAKGAP